jgi:microcin C transport system ATP-binding protein
MIAMALANNPKLLIADEPTTALDVTIQAQILELLAELKREEGMSPAVHHPRPRDRARIADRVCVMKDGEIVEQGPTSEIFADPKHPYTQKAAGGRAAGTPTRCPQTAPKEIAKTDGLRVWFPIQRGLLRARWAM